MVPANLNAGSYALSTLHNNARHEFVSLSTCNVSDNDQDVNRELYRIIREFYS